MLPPDICTCVKEHEPTTGLVAAKLATQYIPYMPTGQCTPGLSGGCLIRHLETVGQDVQKTGKDQKGNPGVSKLCLEAVKLQQSSNNNGVLSTICYYCQQHCHKASVCPLQKNKLLCYCCGPQRDNPGKSDVLIPETASYHPVTVIGTVVLALLDSGSSRSLIKN